MLYCLSLLSGEWTKRVLQKSGDSVKLDQPAMVAVEETIYIMDLLKIGSFKFALDSIFSSCNDKIELIACSAIPVAPKTSENDNPKGGITAVNVKGKIYAMYSRDFFKEFEKLEGYTCPKICVCDTSTDTWLTMDNTPAFSTLSCVNMSTTNIDRSDWADQWENGDLTTISFSKLISDGSDLYLYNHQIHECQHLNALFKYNMEENYWIRFDELPNLLRDVDYFDGENIIIEDLVPAVLKVIKTPSNSKGGKSVSGAEK